MSGKKHESRGEETKSCVFDALLVQVDCDLTRFGARHRVIIKHRVISDDRVTGNWGGFSRYEESGSQQ